MIYCNTYNYEVFLLYEFSNGVSVSNTLQRLCGSIGIDEAFLQCELTNDVSVCPYYEKSNYNIDIYKDGLHYEFVSIPVDIHFV